MRTNKSCVAMCAAAGLTLLAALLAGCSKPAPPSGTAPPAPVTGEQGTQPPTQTQPATEGAPSAPAQPTQDESPPTESSAATTPALAREPALADMRLASPSAKMGVAVELRYSFDSDVTIGQPAQLHLAAIPRGQGAVLRLSVQEDEGLAIAAGPLRFQKASASEVYRQQVAVTKLAAGPANLRVLVRMQMGEDSTFGYFTIPLHGSPANGISGQNPDSVKQH